MTMQIAEAAEDALRIEEGKKDKLCQELNLLVQQSAHAQLERLEQLTQRMESLNRGFVQPAKDPPRIHQDGLDKALPRAKIEGTGERNLETAEPQGMQSEGERHVRLRIWQQLH